MAGQSQEAPRPALRAPLCITAAEVDQLVGIATDSIEALERDIAR